MIWFSLEFFSTCWLTSGKWAFIMWLFRVSFRVNTRPQWQGNRTALAWISLWCLFISPTRVNVFPQYSHKQTAGWRVCLWRRTSPERHSSHKFILTFTQWCSVIVEVWCVHFWSPVAYEATVGIALLNTSFRKQSFALIGLLNASSHTQVAATNHRTVVVATNHRTVLKLSLILVFDTCDEMPAFDWWSPYTSPTC